VYGSPLLRGDRAEDERARRHLDDRVDSGFVWILPLIGSVGGAIMGHISLNQIKRTGEGGRGMALAGVIVGWVGTAISLLIIGFFVFFIILGAAASSRYGSY
jgi:hypothetical protein